MICVLGADSPLDQACQLLRRRLDVGGVEELERRLAAQLCGLAAEDLGGGARRVEEVPLEIDPGDRLGHVREQPREIGRARHFPPRRRRIAHRDPLITPSLDCPADEVAAEEGPWPRRDRRPRRGAEGRLVAGLRRPRGTADPGRRRRGRRGRRAGRRARHRRDPGLRRRRARAAAASGSTTSSAPGSRRRAPRTRARSLPTRTPSATCSSSPTTSSTMPSRPGSGPSRRTATPTSGPSSSSTTAPCRPTAAAARPRRSGRSTARPTSVSTSTSPSMTTCAASSAPPATSPGRT